MVTRGFLTETFTHDDSLVILREALFSCVTASEEGCGVLILSSPVIKKSLRQRLCELGPSKAIFYSTPTISDLIIIICNSLAFMS